MLDDRNERERDWNRRRNGRRLVERFVERRAVEPHDALVVVVEFRRIREIGMVVSLQVVRGKVAVRDCVFVLVARPWLVDVLRGKRRRKGQERRDDKPGSGTGHWMNHVRIIRGRRRAVNGVGVSRWSQTGQ
jgi:hypothetical protein